MIKRSSLSQRTGGVIAIFFRIQLLRIMLIVPGTLVMEFAQAFAFDNSASPSMSLPLKTFTSPQEALQLGEEDLRAGNTEASIPALTYAAASGEVVARWKLGQLYAKGEGVPRDDSVAYHYFNQIVEDYDENKTEQENVIAVSDAFVAVGVYCLNGIPGSDVRPDPQRAHELFQYAATTFADHNAQYNLAHMYMMGAGGLAKDNIAALRWLAIAAKAGHPPARALLGHMLFVTNGVSNHRARGLMWLQLARDGVSNPQGQWITELYQRDFRDASDAERLAAASLLDERTKRMSPPLTAAGSITSFLQPFEVAPADR
jgi:uncharacterized protein